MGVRGVQLLAAQKAINRPGWWKGKFVLFHGFVEVVNKEGHYSQLLSDTEVALQMQVSSCRWPSLSTLVSTKDFPHLLSQQPQQISLHWIRRASEAPNKAPRHLTASSGQAYGTTHTSEC